MFMELAPEIVNDFLKLEHELLPINDQGTLGQLDRSQVKELLPHREPFLLIDRITYVNPQQNLLIAEYDLAHAETFFAGHFPGYPVFPGVLQIEAVGQAGIILFKKQASLVDERFSLTHVCGAKFIKEINKGPLIEMRVKTFEAGYFVYIWGQCIQDGQICSITCLRGIY